MFRNCEIPSPPLITFTHIGPQSRIASTSRSENTTIAPSDTDRDEKNAFSSYPDERLRRSLKFQVDEHVLGPPSNLLFQTTWGAALPQLSHSQLKVCP